MKVKQVIGGVVLASAIGAVCGGVYLQQTNTGELVEPVKEVKASETTTPSVNTDSINGGDSSPNNGG